MSYPSPTELALLKRNLPSLNETVTPGQEIHSHILMVPPYNHEDVLALATYSTVPNLSNQRS